MRGRILLGGCHFLLLVLRWGRPPLVKLLEAAARRELLPSFDCGSAGSSYRIMLPVLAPAPKVPFSSSSLASLSSALANMRRSMAVSSRPFAAF